MTQKPVLILFTSLLMFMAGSSPVLAYGGHHYGYGYHHGYGYGAHVSYGHHGDGDALGYFILGVLGVVLLSHILNQDDYPRPASRPVVYKPAPAPVYKRAPVQRYYFYGKNEGWNLLAKGDAGHALDIFAIQSQQDLDSGIPRIGFALAAAAIGDRERGIRAMRKAISTDPAALDYIRNDSELFPTIDFLNAEYLAAMDQNMTNPDNAFMVAALSYLKQDYAMASNMLAHADQSDSTIKLRELLSKAQ